MVDFKLDAVLTSDWRYMNTNEQSSSSFFVTSVGLDPET